MSLSVIINTKNSEDTLQACLESVKPFASEIVVIDMKSSDNTRAIARKYTRRIYTTEDVGYVEPARNLGLEKAREEWILVIDSDEELPEKLGKRLLSIMKSWEKKSVSGVAKPVAYSIARKNIVFGKWIDKAGWWPDYQLRFFRNGAVTWDDKIHSQPRVVGTKESLPAEEDLSLFHHNYTSVGQFIERLNRYTSKENRSYEKKTAADVVRVFSDEFVSRLFSRQGIELGTHGVGLSFLQSFYEVSTLLKAWEKDGFKKTNDSPSLVINELREFQKKLNYWIAGYEASRKTGWRSWYWRLRIKMRI